ncbi:MAG: hypothetical protein HYY84_01770 [Deltaproteobacteria bacterium]|nr:hypothetical protein [Deltaproteobacteria bacterium]
MWSIVIVSISTSLMGRVVGSVPPVFLSALGDSDSKMKERYFNPNTLALVRANEPIHNRHLAACMQTLRLPGVCLLAQEAAYDPRVKARWDRWDMFVSFIERQAKTPKGNFLCPAECRRMLRNVIPRKIEKRRVSKNPLNKSYSEVVKTSDVYRMKYEWFVHFPQLGLCPARQPFDTCWFSPDTSELFPGENTYFAQATVFATKDIPVYESTADTSPIVSTLKKCELAHAPGFRSSGRWLWNFSRASDLDDDDPWPPVYLLRSAKFGYVKAKAVRDPLRSFFNLHSSPEEFEKTCR